MSWFKHFNSFCSELPSGPVEEVVAKPQPRPVVREEIRIEPWLRKALDSQKERKHYAHQERTFYKAN